MAENKKYFWLKLQKAFYTDVRIKKIRKIAGGDTYIIIYQKMLLESIDNNCILIIDELEDDPAEYLSLLLDEDIDNIKVCLDLLIKLKLCEIHGNEVFFTMALDLIGSKSESAVRVAQHRERKEQINQNSEMLQCNNDVILCNDEKLQCNKTLNIESELELNKEREGKEEKNHLHALDSNFDLETAILNAVQKFGLMCSSFNQVVCFRSPQNREQLEKAIKNARYDIEICIDYALKNTLEQLKIRPNIKPIFEFRDNLYLYLAHGYKNEIPRNYSKAELQAKLIEKEKRELEQKELEQEETRASALEVEKYEQETAMLFDIEIGDVEAFSQKYEGGMIAFFDERRRREEVKIQTWGVPEEVGVTK